MSHPAGPDAVLEELFDAVDLSKRDLTNQVTRDDNTIYGAGAFADVHRGTWTTQRSYTDPHSGVISWWPESRTVAIKELRVFTKRHPTWVKIINKLFHEIGIWCWLDHINVVPFYGYTIDLTGRAGLISQWCEHGNLPDFLKSHPDASQEDIALDIAEGIAYLHGHFPPIVHADLKGANILINQNGIACICDFGVSTFVEDACVQTGFTTTSDLQGGSIRWAAPELFEAENPRKTFASDMYAFGGILLEIFTGKIPYYYLKSDSLVMRAIMKGELPLDEEYSTENMDRVDEEFFWRYAQCLWNPDADMRPTAQATVNALYTSFHLLPRKDITITRRPELGVLDGNRYQFGKLMKIEDLASPFLTSLSPDGNVFCQEVRDGGHTLGIRFYDLSGNDPICFWFMQVTGCKQFSGRVASGSVAAWDTSSTVIAFVRKLPMEKAVIILANIHTRTVIHQLLSDLPPSTWWVDAIRFTSADNFFIAFKAGEQRMVIRQYALLTVHRGPIGGAYIQLQEGPPADSARDLSISFLTPCGDYIKARASSFDLWEWSGSIQRVHFIRDKYRASPHPHLDTLVGASEGLFYLNANNQEDGHGSSRTTAAPLCQLTVYRLLTRFPVADFGRRQHYKLIKMEFCQLFSAYHHYDTYEGWLVCQLLDYTLGIWHCDTPRPLIILDIDANFYHELKLNVCQGIATIAALSREVDNRPRSLKLYRVPLPTIVH